MAKFSKSRVWSEVPEGGVPLFLEVQKFSYTAQCRIGRRKLPRQKQLDSLVYFDRTPFLIELRLVTDTDGYGHKCMA